MAEKLTKEQLQVAMANNQAPLVISKVLGDVINPSLNAAFELTRIADLELVEPGDYVYRFDTLDTEVDQVLDAQTDGTLSSVKRNPVAGTQLVFKGLNSQQEYIALNDFLNGVDLKIFERKKFRISEAMDKLELRVILNAILDGKTPGMAGGTHALEDAIQEISVASGDDLYDIILKMKNAIKDYGDQFTLLKGTNVDNAIEKFDKSKAATFNYNVNIENSALKDVEQIRVFGTVKWTGGLHNQGGTGYADDSSATAIMNADKLILVAKRSKAPEGMGKPIKFVRRKINSEVAGLVGGDVDQAKQRIAVVSGTPVPVGSTQVLGWSVTAYEQVIWYISNPNAICKSADLSSLY